MSQKLDELLKNRLSHSYIEAAAIEYKGKIYNIGIGSIDQWLIEEMNELISRTTSVLLETSNQQVFTCKLGDFTIIIAAKKMAPLSFLRSTCRSIHQIVSEDGCIKERIKSEGKVISSESRIYMLKSYEVPQGKMMLKSTIPFIRPEVVVSMLKDIEGYIWVTSGDVKGLIILKDNKITTSVSDSESTYTGEEALTRIYSLKEGDIECYKFERLPERSIQEGLQLLGLDDDFIDAINEAKRLRQQLSNTINGGV